MREKGVWLGVVVGAFGWLMTTLVLARGGGYLVVVPHLSFVLPLAVVGTVTALAAFGAGRTSLSGVLWLAVIVAAGVAWNFLVYWFRFGNATWGLLLPLAKPTGIDFRDGLYDPAAAFTTAHSGWPPLTLLLGRPFTLLDFSTAYAVQVGILVALAVAAAVLGAKLAMKAACDPDLSGQGRRIGATQLALVLGFWLMTSYGFMYEVERGNIDLYALCFALLAVWLMLRLPRMAWWPAIALAVAINLKLYPGVLLVLLFWRYRWRAIVPALVANAALLLVAGPGNLRNTVTTLTSLQSTQRSLWWGNHSAAALANVLRQVTGWAPSWVYVPLLLIPLALLALTLLLLVRRGWNDRRAVLAAAACVPVMCTTPALSHDYKLVLCVFPLAVLAAVIATMNRRGLAAWSVLFGLLALAMMLLSRSSLVIAPSLLASKYTLLVLLQLLLLAVVWQTECDAAEATQAAKVAVTTGDREEAVE
jgi:Glycosyltransferase family 87